MSKVLFDVDEVGLFSVIDAKVDFESVKKVRIATPNIIQNFEIDFLFIHLD